MINHVLSFTKIGIFLSSCIVIKCIALSFFLSFFLSLSLSLSTIRKTADKVLKGYLEFTHRIMRLLGLYNSFFNCCQDFSLVRCIENCSRTEHYTVNMSETIKNGWNEISAPYKFETKGAKNDFAF